MFDLFGDKLVNSFEAEKKNMQLLFHVYRQYLYARINYLANFSGLFSC